MDIDLLRTFLEVRRLGNFHSAAENLHVTQAADIRPTPAGEQLVPAAESIITTWIRARQEIGLTRQDGPSLSVAATAGVWDLYGDVCLRHMNGMWPETSFKADVLSDDLMVKRLLAQTTDLAFLTAACELEYLNCEAVTSFELALHTTGLKSLEQVLGEPYVYVEWGREVGPAYMNKLGFRQRPALSAGDHLIARNFLEVNGGSAFLPIMPAESDSKLQVITDSPRVRREIFALWHNKNPSQALIGEIVETLRSGNAAASDSISSSRG